MTSRMATEIAEQPRTIQATLDALIPLGDRLRETVGDRRHVLFAARGTSDHAAVYGRYLIEHHVGLGASLAAPSLVTHYDVRRNLSDTVVVSLSQSGTTEEIVETQRWAKRSGAATLAITNDTTSRLSSEADLALAVVAGSEEAVPATKTYTAQLTAVAVLADGLGDPAHSFLDELRAIPEEVSGLFSRRRGVADAVAALRDAEYRFVSGRGFTYGTALEVALKLEETCLTPVRGLSYADLRHGPIAAIDRGVVAVIVAARSGPVLPGLSRLAEQLRERGATTVGIGGDPNFRDQVDIAMEGPAVGEIVSPLGLIVPAQLVVEELARSLRLDPDAPRGLSKVTQTDVE